MKCTEGRNVTRCLHTSTLYQNLLTDACFKVTGNVYNAEYSQFLKCSLGFCFCFFNVSALSFFFFFNLFLKIIFCLCWVFLAAQAFLSLWQVGAPLCCNVWASFCSGFSCCRAQASGVRASVALRLSSCSSRVLEYRLSHCGMQA